MDRFPPRNIEDSWTSHLARLSQCDLLSTSGPQLGKQVSSRSGSLFTPDSVDVRLLDIDKHENDECAK